MDAKKKKSDEGCGTSECLMKNEKCKKRRGECDRDI